FWAKTYTSKYSLKVKMCGKFSQSLSCVDYLSPLSDEAERNILYEPNPTIRFYGSYMYQK
ncbi:hypothetical protein ACR9IN_24520, partial [Citrobacter portucalensis]